MQAKKSKLQYRKVGNTSFNVDEVKAMGFKAFKERFKGRLNVDLKQAYDEIKKGAK